MNTSTKCERSNGRCNFRTNAVAADQVLSAIGGKGKGFCGSADQSIPQNPAAQRSRVLLLGHGSSPPFNKRVQRIGRNDRATADANSPQATSRDMRIKGSSA